MDLRGVRSGTPLRGLLDIARGVVPVGADRLLVVPEDEVPVAMGREDLFLPDMLGDLVSLDCFGGDGERTVAG